MIQFDPKGWRPCDFCRAPDACWKGNIPCTRTGEIRDRLSGQWVSPIVLSFSVHYRNQERLPMWVVYRPGPGAHPEYWTARLFWTLPEEGRTNFVIAGTSLERLREAIPLGTYRIERFAEDAPEIVEAWL